MTVFAASDGPDSADPDFKPRTQVLRLISSSLPLLLVALQGLGLGLGFGRFCLERCGVGVYPRRIP